MDAHCWVERNGKIIDTFFDEYKLYVRSTESLLE